MKVIVCRVGTNVNLLELYHDVPPAPGDTLLIGDEVWQVVKRITDYGVSPITMYVLVSPPPPLQTPLDLRPKGGSDAGDQ